MRHRYSLRLGQALVVASLLPCAGCSLLFVKPPEPSGKIQTDVPKKCTTSRAMPILDTIVTGLQIARTGIAINADDSVYSDPNQPLSRGADIALGLGFTALFAGSALYGYSATARCEERSNPEDYRETTADTDPPERWSGPEARPPAKKAPVRPASAAADKESQSHSAETTRRVATPDGKARDGAGEGPLGTVPAGDGPQAPVEHTTPAPAPTTAATTAGPSPPFGSR